MLEKPEKVAAERVAATLVVAEKTARSQAGTSPAATTFRTFGIPYSTEELKEQIEMLNSVGH